MSAIKVLENKQLAFVYNRVYLKQENVSWYKHVLYDCINCANITGLHALGDRLYLLYDNGTLVENSNHEKKTFNIYNISGVMRAVNFGSLTWNSFLLPDKDLLLLADEGKGEIFTYRISTQQKTVRLRGLNRPTSVTYAFFNNTTNYIVCEQGASIVSMYSSSWRLKWNCGGLGSEDGRVDNPHAAIMMPEGTILVSDYNNNRLSEFTSQGQFLHHLPISRHITHPTSLSFSFPLLCVIHRNYKYINCYYMY